MTSKEALDRLHDLALPSSSSETWEHRQGYCERLYNIIKQDLHNIEECCGMLERTVKNLRKVINILQTNFFIDLIEREKDYKLGFAPKKEIKGEPRFCELSKEKGDFLKEFFYE